MLTEMASFDSKENGNKVIFVVSTAAEKLYPRHYLYYNTKPKSSTNIPYPIILLITWI